MYVCLYLLVVNRQMTEETDECVGQSRRRVKLYTLNEDRVWEDQGTGHVAYSYDEFKATSLVVRSEVDGMSAGHLLLNTQLTRLSAWCSPTWKSWKSEGI